MSLDSGVDGDAGAAAAVGAALGPRRAAGPLGGAAARALRHVGALHGSVRPFQFQNVCAGVLIFAGKWWYTW